MKFVKIIKKNLKKNIKKIFMSKIKNVGKENNNSH